MKKYVLVILLVLCLLLPGCGKKVLSEPLDGDTASCTHENSTIELTSPAGFFKDSYYSRVCPDCGMTQTLKRARTAGIDAAFDRLARFFFRSDDHDVTPAFTVTAHTGPDEIPQNSKFSLTYSLASGADVVEFDLALNAEGVAVLAHGSPEEAKMTLEEAFAQVAACYGVRVNVDVKNVEAVGLAQELALRYGIADRIFYTGVYEENVPYLQEHSPLIPYYINISAPADAEQAELLCARIAEEGAIGLNFNYHDYSPELAASARAHGLLLSVYTVNSIKELRMMLDYDIDNITTEFPYKLYTMTNGLAELAG